MLPSESKNLLPPKDASGVGRDEHPNHLAAPLPPGGGEPEPMAGLTNAGSTGFGNLSQAFIRRWPLALGLATLAAVLGGGLAWFLVPAQYTSSVVIKLTRENDENVTSVQKAQTANVKSFEVLNEAVQRSRVQELYGMSVSVPSLQKRMVVDFLQGPELMTVSLSGENPEAVAAILTALAEVYPQRLKQADEIRFRDQVEVLNRMLEDRKDNPNGLKKTPTLTEQLTDKRVELAEAERRAGLDDAITIRAKHDSTLESLRSNQARLFDVQVRRGREETELAALQVRATRPSEREALVGAKAKLDAEMATNEQYRKFQAALTEIEGRMALIRDTVRESEQARFLKAHQDAEANLERKIQNLRETTLDRLIVQRKGEMIAEYTQNIEKLRSLIGQEEQEELKLKDKITQLQIEAEKLRTGPRVPTEVARLRDEVDRLVKEREAVVGKLASLRASGVPARAERVTEAFVPTEKDFNRQLKFAGGTAAGAFALFLFGICFTEARAQRVYGPKDVTRSLGMSLVGTLPKVPEKGRQVVGPDFAALDGQFGLAEAIDGIRTVLLHSPRLDGARVIMVTSAVGGEGKTTLATHLAASLARAWRKTLLIDCDLRNPEAHLPFGVSSEPGFCEALRNEVEFEDVIRDTPLSRLWILPAGKCDTYALQALAQEGLGTIFDHFKEQYDFIVVDTSPVLPVSDALQLGKYADAVLLAVLRDVSRVPAVQAAQHKIQNLGIRLLGAVVLGEKSETYGHTYPIKKDNRRPQ